MDSIIENFVKPYMPAPLFFIPIIAGAILVGLLYLGRFIQRKFFSKKCQICGKKESDILSRGKQRWFLCRKHLLEKYSELFLENTFKVVMVDFFSDQRLFKHKYDIFFTYYPISEFKQYASTKDEPTILIKLLESIDSQKCIECDSKSTVLFVNKNDVVWKEEFFYRFGWNYYIILSQDYLVKGQYLCNKHTLARVKVSLQTYPKPITRDGGVWLPYKDDGFQTPA